MIVTFFLVYFEAKYNIDLLNTLSDQNALSSSANDLSQRGKVLAAFGLSWAVGKGLLSKIRPAIVGIVLFCTLAMGTYHGLDWVYGKVIADLKPEVKVKGFNLFTYRHDLLDGSLIDPDIPLPKNEPVLGKIFMGAFPIVMLDERFMLPAQDIVERKANDKGNIILKKAEKSWPDYDSRMREMSNAHLQIVDASKKAQGISTADRDWMSYSRRMQELLQAHSMFVESSKKASGSHDYVSEWSSYNQNMAELSGAHERFIEGSRKAARYGSRGAQSFRQQSGGLEPDASMSRTQFVAMLKRASHPEGEKLRQSENRVVFKKPDGGAIYGRDVPYFMSKVEFNRWMTEQAKNAIQSGGLEPNPTISPQQFVSMLKNSKHPKGSELRKAESMVVGKKANGEPLYGRDFPYFMTFPEFSKLIASHAKEVLTNLGFEPNQNLTREQFLTTLRNSPHPRGEELREAEKKELGKRPDGSSVLVRDVPYFMSRKDYVNWAEGQIKDMRDMAIPTEKNVENFAKIRDVNAAIFLPPMAIISSLTSALTNGISLVLMIIGVVLASFSLTKRASEVMERFSVPIMLLIFCGLLYLMPSHVFNKNTPIYDLETLLHEEVGFAGKVWSRLSNLEKFIL